MVQEHQHSLHDRGGREPSQWQLLDSTKMDRTRWTTGALDIHCQTNTYLCGSLADSHHTAFNMCKIFEPIIASKFGNPLDGGISFLTLSPCLIIAKVEMWLTSFLPGYIEEDVIPGMIDQKLCDRFVQILMQHLLLKARFSKIRLALEKIRAQNSRKTRLSSRSAKVNHPKVALLMIQ